MFEACIGSHIDGVEHECHKLSWTMRYKGRTLRGRKDEKDWILLNATLDIDDNKARGAGLMKDASLTNAILVLTKSLYLSESLAYIVAS